VSVYHVEADDAVVEALIASGWVSKAASKEPRFRSVERARGRQQERKRRAT
jgi:hypothetical protein